MKSSKIKKAPEALADAPTPQEEAVSMGASPITSSTKAMFAKPESATVTSKDAKAAAKPAKPDNSKVKQTAKVLAKEMVPAPPPPKMGEKLEAIEKIQSPELKKLGEGFLLEELQDLYTNPAPRAYVPETHRNFAKFIKMNYEDFILPPPGEGPAIQPGDKYPYQKFIREYMRQASPYRGILVYHGLGSGKTCSAIAASEALFATAGKKIIVMTPFSLRKNFLKEVSFCGFRHFRLLNFWVGLDKTNPTHKIFALEILGLSEGYLRTATKIWVPDFDQKTPNYEALSATEQTEIRKQILSQLVWDAEKNPKGRIRFINYNGISAKKLKKLACETPDFFDDAVIVVDEIHNLVRLIQGEIDPYLKDLPGKKRKVAREAVTVDPWKPSLCGKETNYRRGYLFYRLMLSARRSKLIGLSGTPLINFPEELGILSNILHGYIPLFKGTLKQTGDEAQAAIKKVATDHPHIDFGSVERSNDALAGTELTATLLPDGIRKVKGTDGVERMSTPGLTPAEIMSSLVEALKGSGFTFHGGREPTLVATPLLHPFGDEFREDFLTPDGLDVKNKFILAKRLTGLISYYKGSREDLMPAVASDEVIRVPFSSFSQGAYSKIRLEEINIEMKKKDKGTGGLGNVWAEVYDIGQMQQSSNYRMGSRQMCNFAFPTTVTRPRARNTEEEEMENVEDKEIIDTAPDNAPDAPTEAEAFDFPEMDEAPEDETGGQEDEVSEDQEKRQIYAALNKIFGKMTEEGKTIEDIKEKDEGGREYFKVAIPLSEEKLALINGDFKTLVFTPEGFSGVTGDDFTDDIGVLTSRFPMEGGVGEDDKPAGTISFKEAMARRRAAGTGLQAVRSLAAAPPVAEPEVSNAAVAAVAVAADAAPVAVAADAAPVAVAADAAPVAVAAPLAAPAAEPVAAPAPTMSFGKTTKKATALAAEIKALDKQVKIQEAKKAKEGPVKETALEKMFAKMRDKDGKLPYHLAIGVEVDKAGRIAGASETQISAAIRVAQEVFRSRKAAGASDEEALADGKTAGAKEYAVISEENKAEYDEGDDDAEVEEPAPTISFKQAMAKKKAQVQAQAQAQAQPTITYAEAMAKRREAQTKATELEQQLEAIGAVKPVKQAAPVQEVAVKPQEQARCKGPRQDGETYKQALVRAKSCLRTIAADKLLLSDTVDDSLARYSPKYAAILKRVMDAPGSSLVYSQFLDMEGIGIFRVVMDINGFAPIEIVSTPAGPAFTPQTEASLKKAGGQMRYMSFSGEEKEDVRRMALDVFNARFDELPERMKTVLQEAGFKNNHTGQLCRVFCITSAGAEGLSLKNVRAVHIMEPYWNDVRLKQVKGRAIRIGSHLELPPEQRNVSIYTYISVFGGDAQSTKEGDFKIDETIRLRDMIDRPTAEKVGLPIPASAASYVLTSDERLYVISERKKKVIEELEKVMKGAAVDCELSWAENKDGTFQCLSLDKMVGDFAYEPELKKDIAKSEYSYTEEARLIKKIKWKSVPYLAGADRNEKGVVTGFTLYADTDRDLAAPLGKTGVAIGKSGPAPAEPVEIF